MLNTTISDLATELAQKAEGGGAARAQIGDTSIAFQWSEGLPAVLARYVDSAKVTGLSFSAVRVKASATPAGIVAENAPKNVATELEDVSVPLQKFAGVSKFSLESALSITALIPALSSTIVGQCLTAYDAVCIAALAADHGSEATGASWTEAILAGLAEVASAGQSPSLLIMSPADYAATILDPGSVGGFTTNPADGMVSLFGLTVGMSIGAVAGTAYVVDARSVVCAENVSSPTALLDPYSLSTSNQVVLVVDLIAGVFVTQPAGVCEVTVTAAAGTQSDYSLGA